MSTPQHTSPIEGGAKFTEDFEGRTAFRPDGDHASVAESSTPKRSSTLRKKNSVSRKSSLKRSGSKRSIGAGSIRSLHEENKRSVFYTPVPTHANPTELLAKRFESWRKVLKDFITYFKEVQQSYEARARGITKITHTLNSTVHPPDFVESGGILETNSVLRDFHKEAFVNTESAARLEAEVISNLIGLRSDLNVKIKEIKSLSHDFKNNVDKEKEQTRKEVQRLQDALAALDVDPSNATGSKDPYIVRLAVEKQLKRQLAEENYLHRAYLNIEHSGRELESIVVAEVQKAFDAYVKIIRREGEELFDMAERLTASTLRLPPDYEWSAFVERDPNMIDPESTPLRAVEDIEYPGCQHPAALEIRSGMMERKSKYLKSYTPAWFVLSPTHLHEFKSSERTREMTPVMSLYLPESQLGKHSEPHATSHKFMLKARQTGAMHRGHSWVFRAESHEMMMQWYNDILKLTQVSGTERDAFVADATQRHSRSMSTTSQRRESYSSNDGLEHEEADDVPFSIDPSVNEEPIIEQSPQRPEGGRFPSEISVNRGLEERQVRGSLSNDSSSAIAAAGALPGSDAYAPYRGGNGVEHETHPQIGPRYGDSAYSQGANQPQMEQSYILVPGGAHEHTEDPESTRSFDEPKRISKDYRQEMIPVETDMAFAHEPIAHKHQDGYNTGTIPNSTDTPKTSTADEWSPVMVTTDHPVPRSSAGESGMAAEPSTTGEALHTAQAPAQNSSIKIIDASGPLQSSLHAPNVRQKSEGAVSKATISDLHVPGEYPKNRV